MCDWCTKHGDGKKWYQNVKNYTRDDFLKDEAVIESANRFFKNVESISGMGAPRTADLLKLKNDDQFTKTVMTTKQATLACVPHRGQVVPLEDVREIIKLTGPMAKMSCVCRRALRANFDEKTCIFVGPVYLEYAKEWPDFTRGGIDYISKEEALELMEGFNKKGYVPTFWMDAKTPAVMCFCNCEFPSCSALRSRRFLGDWYNFFLRKAEYVIKQNPNNCTGCGRCLKRCQFSAITYSPYLEKAIFDMKKCAGCGLCRTVCDQDALKLVPRSEVSAVKGLW